MSSELNALSAVPTKKEHLVPIKWLLCGPQTHYGLDVFLTVHHEFTIY